MSLLFFPPCVIKALLVFWEPRSIWHGPAPASPAAPPADCPTECGVASEETTQVDPAAHGSVILGKEETGWAGLARQVGR